MHNIADCSLRAVYLLFILTFSYQCLALQQVDEKTLKTLSDHAVWHKLLYYEKNNDFEHGYASAIHSPEFFLSNNGKVDSQAELQATISALYEPVGTNPNQHAQCRFKGRYLWLKQQIPELDHAPTIDCPDYNNWTINNTVESISIIFATGYLGNPASYYGHTLIKLNSSKINHKTKLEDVSVNFGAIIPDHDGILTYISKGIFGGYDAGFSHTQYYFHNHNYGENELRDLWEYQLDLTPLQTQLIIGHAWEVLGKKYTYFFLDKNCVYRMAELLEVIEGLDVIPDNQLWTIPQSLLQDIAKIKLDNKPLVKKISYHPSRQSRLYSRYASLNKNEKNAVTTEIYQHASLNSKAYSSLTLKSKHQVLDTLIDYYQYLRKPEKLASDTNNTSYRKILAERFKLPPGEQTLAISTNKAPHQGRKPSLIQVGASYNNELDTGIKLRFRPAYYDALDSDKGHIENSVLSMAELEATALAGEFRINSFDAVKIESINATNTGLPGDRSFAWKLSLGVYEAANNCTKKCLITTFQGAMGYTLPTTKGFLLGAYAGGSLQESKLSQGAVVASATAFADIDSGYGIKTRLSVEHRNYVFGSASSTNRLQIETHYQYNNEVGFRAYLNKSETREVGIAIAKYF